MNLKTYFGPDDNNAQREASGLYRIPPEATKARFHVFSVNDDGSTSHVSHGGENECRYICATLNANRAPGALRYEVVNSNPKDDTAPVIVTSAQFPIGV
jgi:hypothetical protein